ncbi:PREDICTED: psbP-like protein 2, chloroplastic-like [Fragaria vesca subsp. vesca]
MQFTCIARAIALQLAQSTPSPSNNIKLQASVSTIHLQYQKAKAGSHFVSSHIHIMAISSLSLSWVSTTLPDNKIENFLSTKLLECEGIPDKFRGYVDKEDGYSYYYPSDWRDFDFRAHDSAFKDRYMQLHNVRVRFIPTDKTDIHDLGPLEEAVPYLVRHKFAAPNQVEKIFNMQEKTIDGKNYYTFEYGLTSPNFATTSFATIAIGNGRYYTLIVGANERRWKRYRNQLKMVADSFRILDI